MRWLGPDMTVVWPIIHKKNDKKEDEQDSLKPLLDKMGSKNECLLNKKGAPTPHTYLSRGIPIEAIAPDVMDKPNLSQFKSHWWDVPSTDNIQRELQYEVERTKQLMTANRERKKKERQWQRQNHELLQLKQQLQS